MTPSRSSLRRCRKPIRRRALGRQGQCARKADEDFVRIAKGPRITRGVRRFLLALVLSDIRQSIFARVARNPYLWFFDEAHNLFKTQSQQEDVAEILNTGRSFGTFFHFITQHLETAISKREILDILHQNLIWSFTLRSNPKDCSFLQSVMPVSGRLLKPSRPFHEAEFLTRAEEQRLLFEQIAHFPNRAGYLFIKAHTPTD